MHTYRELEITEIWPSSSGFYIIASYSDWCSGFCFFIPHEGVVQGRTDDGVWLEVGPEISSCIRSKLQYAVFDSGRLHS
jgi:hypothetical protein